MGSLDYRGSAGVENGPSQKTGTIDAYNVKGHYTARMAVVITGSNPVRHRNAGWDGSL
jgi:hypothetical protein